MIIPLVGMLGTGKTHLGREKFIYPYIGKREIFIYTTKAEDFQKPKCKVNLKVYNDLRRFIVDTHKKRNSVGFIDEAATCIPDDQPDINNLKKLLDDEKQVDDYEQMFMTYLANSREWNNLIVPVYHDFTELPLWLMKKSNYVLRFQTNDQYNIQATRFKTFPNLVESFNQPDSEQPKGLGNFDEIKIR